MIDRLSALGIHPKKGLGQNFLVDPAHRARIVAAADLTADDTVLEIGPGPGVLTELIAEQAGRVVAVELDDRLIPVLRERFAGQPHVSIVHADILKVDVGALISEPTNQRISESANGESRNTQYAIRNTQYKVVANLPYYITSAAIRHLLESVPPPELLVLTVQREVAERMVASPPDMSLLALGVQFYATARIVEHIPAGAFYPKPKVDSAVVRLERRPEPVVSGVSAESVLPGGARRVQPTQEAASQLVGSGAGSTPSEGRGVADSRRYRTSTQSGDVDAWRSGARWRRL